jgi:hypothetical protein
MAQISKRKNNFEMKLCIMGKGLGVFLAISSLIFSCSADEPVIPDMGYDYYPLQVGRYTIYEVEETSISQSVETEVSYEIRVTVADSSINQQGIVTYVLVREKRADASDNWESLDTWSTEIINNRLVQNEGNTLFVKLIFPPSLNLSWNGNQFNDLTDNGEIFYDGDVTQYRISEINQPVTLNTGFTANSSLTVLQNDYNDDFTGIDERKEIFSKDDGLIFKEVIQKTYCSDFNDPCYGQQKVDNGFIFIQSLKEHGQL